ncbi:hypothetical protein GCM10027213_25300 [Mycobacterium bourgelatii]
MWLRSFQSSGKVLLAAAEIVAPSSYQNEGRPAQAPLINVASTEIASGSSSRPRAGGRAGSPVGAGPEADSG